MEDAKPKIKSQILHLLKTQGAQTATALAEQLAVSPMAIRQHLQALRAEQQVTYHEERRPLGRPVKLWSLTAESTHQFPDSHADLMLDLLRSMETVFGADGVEKLINERSRRQIQTYHARLDAVTAPENWRERVAAIAQLRSQEGYMAEVIDQGEAGVLLVENHCPIGTAAKACQGLCRAELEVFRSLLGVDVTVDRVEHILQGDRRCAYRVQKR